MNYSTYALETQFSITELITVYHQTFSTDYHFKGEVHNFWEFVYIKDGGVGVTADAQIYDLHKGQAIFHPPGEFHSIWNLSDCRSQVFILTFRMDHLLPIHGLKPCLSDHALYLIQSLISHTEKLTMCYHKDQEQAYLDTPQLIPYGYNQILKNTLELIIIDILNYSDVATLPTVVSCKEPDRLLYTHIISYIHTNLLLTLDISTICKHCQVSPSTLKRLFKKYAGIGTMAYVNEMKLNHAIQRLSEGLAIQIISEELSFSSQHYFTYFFKKKTGLTPTEYKSRFLKKL